MSGAADTVEREEEASQEVFEPPRWTFVAMLIAVAATSPLGINVYLPSMPGMAQAFEVDFATIQLTLSLYLAAVAVGQLVLGPLSDYFGRRPVLLAGLSAFIVGTVICLLAPNIGVLLFGRVVQALGGCAGIVLSRAAVRDLYGRDQAASMIGYVTMGMAVAPMLAPSIGGGLEAIYGWRASFVFLLLFGGVALLAAFRLLYETNPQRGAERSVAQMLREYGELARSRVFWGYALTTGFSTAVFFCFVAGASFVTIEQMGRSPLEYGLYFALVPAGYMVGNFLSGRFAHRYGADRLVLRGCLVIAAGVAAMMVMLALGWLHPAALFGPMFVVGIGNGLVIPSGVAGAVSVKPQIAGAASGLSGSVQMGFGALVAPLVGALLAASAWPMVIVMGACAVLALLAFAAAQR
ncbi:hypothetical protein CAI21_18275 [Alkalilimnicola ehrlichii]|uniref:Bcr/CflA family efflux transporter n=1 Tax=Alkalilimnicola ehrlichii TaxID=351052 RepID=A0A3E0WQ66_9GAMM|nr:multidrug effflux MFS transporter [Alkalilimnicola ehrlichii]RFA25804.1 hypothetical protein CAI21_18275 [Alkalilimnicola ehrlichii]RFA35094.1 hypothetical protein CAL65_13365 [Alkalilimnicola ehrlichii]